MSPRARGWVRVGVGGGWRCSDGIEWRVEVGSSVGPKDVQTCDTKDESLATRGLDRVDVEEPLEPKLVLASEREAS